MLRDGASSLYGTDAIGGVINFITRSDFRAAASRWVRRAATQGRKSESANVGFGFGDLANQGFNLRVLRHHKQHRIDGLQRPFNADSSGCRDPFRQLLSDVQHRQPRGSACTSPAFLTPPATGPRA